MRAEDCKRLDRCPTVRSLYDREWPGQAELAIAICKVCETCPGPPSTRPPEALESSRARRMRTTPCSDGPIA